MKKIIFLASGALWLFTGALWAHGGAVHGGVSVSTTSGLDAVFLFAIVPLFAGIFLVFALRRLREKTMNYFLYVALGLMIFLFVSISAELWSLPKGPGLWSFVEIPFGFLIGSMTLLVYYSFKMSAFRTPMEKAMPGEFTEKVFLLQPPTEKERTRFNAFALSVAIAWGIGLHAIGEGIYIASKVAESKNYIEFASVALHKVIEGLGIVVPIAFLKISWNRLFGLGLIASAPMAVGYVLGSWFGSPFLQAIAVGVIFYGIVMLSEMAFRSYRADQNPVHTFFVICFSLALFMGLDFYLEFASKGGA